MRDERIEVASEFYDKVVVDSPSYNGPPEQMMYHPLWLEMLKHIDKSESIFDLGCGVGQFADIAFKNGHNYAQGVDYSKETIRLAKERLPEHADLFRVANLYDEHTCKGDYDVFVLSEVLEHLKEDLLALGHIPRGKHIVASVPSFDNIAHVRYFDSSSDVQERYSDTIDAKVDRFVIYGNLFFIINGHRR